MIAEVPVKGYFEENCFFYIDDRTKHGFIIDPGAQADRLLNLIGEKGWTIEKILLTHGHFDHMSGSYRFEECFLSKEDEEVYRRHSQQAYIEELLKGEKAG